MFDNVPQFRVELKNIWDVQEIGDKTLVNKIWVLENGEYTPLFYYINKDKLTIENFVKIVANFNKEFLNHNIEKVTIDANVLSNNKSKELCSTLKFFIMFHITFGIKQNLLTPIIFKNTPFRFNNLIKMLIPKPIVEINRRDIIDVDCRVLKHEEISNYDIFYGKMIVEVLGLGKRSLTFIYHTKNNLLLIDNDLSHYYDFMKDPHNAYTFPLSTNIPYYELNIINYFDENHKSYTILVRLFDVSRKNKALTVQYVDDILNIKYKRYIKFSKVREDEENFIIDDKYTFNKAQLLVMNPTLYNKLKEIATS